MVKTRTIKVAAAQLPGLPLDQANESLRAIEQAISDAARRGADLLALPECAYPAYCLGSAQAYRDAETIGSDAFVARLCELAKRNNINLICGFVEEKGDALYNSAVAIDASGNECGRCSKLYLWADDNDYFQPGETLEPFDMPCGRVGVFICADGRAPEITAALVHQGAELLVDSTCWVDVANKPGEYANVQAEFMAKARVMECGVPLIVANKFGQETPECGYCGWSVIYDAQGNALAQAPPDAPALIDADLQLVKPKPIELPDWTWRRLFSDCPAIPPEVENSENVRLAIVPTRMVKSMSDDDDGLDLFQRLAQSGVHILGTNLPNQADAERLDVYGRALGMCVIDFPFVERLMIERFGAFGCISAKHVNLFAPARVIALDGASIIFVIGDAPLEILRSRATENRIFIAAASEETAHLINPDGKIIASIDASSDKPLVADIDLRDAANKIACPKTNIWEQRSPTLYAKAFSQSKPQP